jgi:hypothetical protein
MRPHRAVVAVGLLGVLLVCSEAWAQTGSSRNSNSRNSSSSRSSKKTIQSASDLMSKYAPPTGAEGLTDYAESMQGQDAFVGADANDRGAFIGRGGNLDGTDNAANQSGSTRNRSNRNGTNASRSNRYGNSRNGQLGNNRLNQYGNNRNGQYGNGRNGQRGNNRNGQPVAEFLPTVKLGFDCPMSKDLSTRLTAQLQQTTRASVPKSVQLDCKEGVAVLRGTVATDHERNLMEQLIALEPGVRRVDNQLTVAPSAAPSTPAAP